MFFAKPGEYKPCGLFSLQHIILLFITIVLIIIALKLTKTNKKENIRKIIISVTIFCWIMEIIKIVFNLKIGNAHNVNTYIPLYYCSILLYVGILSSFGKGKAKRLGDVFLATGAFVGGSIFLLFPTTSLPTYPIFHYISLQSFLYHGCMVYLSLLVLKTNYIELEKKDAIYYFILILVISVVALIINNIFGSNLMFISQNFPNTFVNVIYVISGKLFTPVMILGQATLPFWIVYEITNLIKKENENAINY